MKFEKLAEMFDTRKEHRREHGDHNWHQAIDAAPVEVWLWSNGKKVYGPFKSREAAASFKKNRPDRIPADAVIK